MNEIYSSAQVISQVPWILKRLYINNFGTDKQRHSNWPYVVGGDYFYPKSIERRTK